MGISMINELLLDDLVAVAQSESDNDSDAMDAILRRFEPLAKKIGVDVAWAEHTRDDATNGARWGLVLAVQKHKPATFGFPKYAALCMRQEATRWARKDDRSATAPCDYLAGDDAESLAAPEVVETIVDLDAALAVLKVEQREIVVRRYVDDQPLIEIAADLGVTVSAVSQRLATIHKRLAGQVNTWTELLAA